MRDLYLYRLAFLLFGAALTLFGVVFLRRGEEGKSPARWVLSAILGLNIGFVVYLWFNHIGFPLNLDLMEGTILEHFRRAAALRPVYPEPTPAYVPLAYNPLFYYLAVPFSWIFGVDLFTMRFTAILGMIGSGAGGAPVALTLGVSNPDGDPLTWTVGAPAHGMLTGTAAGLMQDSLTTGIVGIGSLGKTLVGYLAGVAGRAFIVTQPLPRLPQQLPIPRRRPARPCPILPPRLPPQLRQLSRQPMTLPSPVRSPLSSAMRLPCWSHIPTLPSPEAVRIMPLSGLNATRLTISECPLIVVRGVPSRSHNRAVPSFEPVTIDLLSGLNAA